MAIHSISDLRAEIAHLKHQKKEQELAIKERFSSPTAIFDTVFSSAKKSDVGSMLFNPDELIGLSSRFVLPLILNKTIFRSSNFIVKTLVTLLSQQASGIINSNTVTSVWDSIRSLIAKVSKKKRTAADGMPPYGEGILD